jgi:hypothetical protein
MMTGCNEGKVIFWDSSFKPLKTIELSKLTGLEPGVRSLDYDEASQTVLVGTRGADVFEIKSDGTRGTTIV